VKMPPPKKSWFVTETAAAYSRHSKSFSFYGWDDICAIICTGYVVPLLHIRANLLPQIDDQITEACGRMNLFVCCT